jgi:hypothetical protein
MAVDDAGSGINDDICAEEPDTEEMEMGEEDDEASAAAAAATGGEGSAETTLGAGKKRVARPSAKKRRAGASEDRFVGDPIPDAEARQRWPQRYTAKVIRRPSLISVSASRLIRSFVRMLFRVSIGIVTEENLLTFVAGF